MATWGDGNFDSDDAQEYLELMAAKLVATIIEVATDRSRIHPGEDGEALLMPSVELLALLCERYNARPPKPDMIGRWGQRYLNAITAPGTEISSGRRKVVENTFRWLHGVAESYWEAT